MAPQQALLAALERYLSDAAANASTELRVLLPRARKTTAATDAVQTRVRREIETIATWPKPLIQQKLVVDLPAEVIHALIFGPAGRLIEASLLGAGSVDWVEDAPALAEAAWRAPRHDPMASNEVKKSVRRSSARTNQAKLAI